MSYKITHYYPENLITRGGHPEITQIPILVMFNLGSLFAS